MFATRHGHLDVATLLVEAGANKAVANSDGRTALTLATELGRSEIALLLDGADT